MSDHALHYFLVYAIIEPPRDSSMSEHVRIDLACDPGFCGVLLEHVQYHESADRLDRLFPFCGENDIRAETFLSIAQILAQIE